MYLALERYSRPNTVEECLRLLAEPGQRAALLSGGTQLNASGHEQLSHVIDLQALPFDQVMVEGDTLIVGSRVTLRQLRTDPALQGSLSAALREAAAGYANLAIQNRATIGGRIVVDRPDQDLPPALLALGARLRLARLDGDAIVEETVDYPVGAAAREALEGAVITEVIIELGEGRSAHRRFGRTAVDLPLASAAAVVRDSGVRLAANLQGPSAADLRRLAQSEKLASGWLAARPADWRKILRGSLLDELSAHEDAWASGRYRRDLTATLLIRALAAAFGEEEIA